MEEIKFKATPFGERLRSMLSVDISRMLRTKLFYILLLIALLIPIVMNVMMTMMDGTESIDQATGEVVVMHGPENAWQSIGTLPGEGGGAMGGMDVMAMCNINMMFMAVAVFVCLFISEEFRSGYVKNLFAVRAEKSDYVVSKTVTGFIVGAALLVAYFIGAMLGGAVCSLSFDIGSLSGFNILMCMLSKIFLMLVFVSIFVAVSVAAKAKAWLAICASLGGGMLLFMTVSMITPLESTFINLLLCLVGGVLFAIGLGALSNTVLKKTSLV